MDISSETTIGFAFLVAAVLSFISTPYVKWVADKVGAVDVPKDKRRMHTIPIPRLGGLAIFFGFLMSTLIFAPINIELRGILIGALIIVLVGVADDISPMKARVKLMWQIVAAIFPVIYGVRMEMITNFFGDGFIVFGNWSYLITILWIVGVTNAVNLIDGLDGLAVGVSSIASFSLFVIALLSADFGVALLAATLFGACIGFLPFNFNPAKIFMGDTGALFLGYILATMSVEGLFKFYTIISFAVPFLILALPIFDTGFAIVRRVMKGKSPMAPDRGHLHHKMIDMGFSQKQTVVILYAVSAILGMSAVIITGDGIIRMVLFMISLICAGIIGYKIFSSKNSKADDYEEDTKEENGGNKKT